MREFLIAFTPEDAADGAEQDEAIDYELTQIILDAQEEAESETRVLLFQSRIDPVPLGDEGMLAELPEGVHRFETPYDLDRADWRGTGTIRLHYRPVLCVQEISIRYAGAAATSPTRRFGPGQIDIKHGLGVINVSQLLGIADGASPRASPFPYWGRSGSWALTPMGGGHQPGALAVSYTAGLLPRTFNPDTHNPSTLCPHFPVRLCIDLVMMKAALMCLRKMQDAVGAGGGAIGMYGLNESYDANRFAGRMQSYDAKIEKKKREVERTFGGGMRMFTK
ncbi:MAG: hypothetical protein EON58_21655 [Alphaproteobacteria bacterium]|nr:MAG: hypothetical protein EON58_21655 [Alphaproteobacteria bacterium]